MNKLRKPERILGAAFLLQAVTSLSSGMLLMRLIDKGSITQSMANIAHYPALMRLNILLEMITAMGIIFLGSVLFVTLRKQNEKVALTALGLYILEAVILAGSRMEGFSLLRISQVYIGSAQSADLASLARIAYDTMDFAYGALLMLAFCIGGILFYYLMLKSLIVPRALSLWGLITIFPMLAGTIAQIFGSEISFYFYLPYVPFEFVIGIWISIKGIRET